MFVYRQDWDKDLSGGITVEQMREIFRIYKVLNTKYRFTICYCWSTGQWVANNNFDLYLLQFEATYDQWQLSVLVTWPELTNASPDRSHWCQVEHLSFSLTNLIVLCPHNRRYMKSMKKVILKLFTIFRFRLRTRMLPTSRTQTRGK